MDERYWESGRGSAFVSPPLLPDSKALRSESDNFATRAKGSCGVDPAPVRSRILTFSVSSKGDWLYGERKRLRHVGSFKLISSAFAILNFIASAV